jgi:hypothetical protein
MTISLRVSNGYEYVSLSDGTICTFLEYSGLGMSPGHANTSRGPQQHGETYIDYRLDPRTFELVFGVKGPTWSDIQAQTEQLYRLFKFRSDLIRFLFQLDNYEERAIDAHFKQGFSLPRSAAQPTFQRVAVQFEAPDPILYSDNGVVIESNLGGGAAGFTVPTPVPTEIGVSTANTTVTVTNPGSWLAYPWIKITGPITSPIITNNTTGEVLDFTGTTIAAGHYYIINCAYGVKSVTSDLGANKIADLTATSDLATFHIEADPDAPSGSNSITITGTSITAASQLNITFRPGYVGLA